MEFSDEHYPKTRSSLNTVIWRKGGGRGRGKESLSNLEVVCRMNSNLGSRLYIQDEEMEEGWLGS